MGCSDVDTCRRLIQEDHDVVCHQRLKTCKGVLRPFAKYAVLSENFLTLQKSE